MAKEYIERKPILKFIEDGLNNPDKTKAFGHDAIEIMTEVQYAPTADVVEVKHGRWVDRYGGKYANPLYECSECKKKPLYKHKVDDLGNEYFIPELSDFCPHCGAKMDGGRSKA